MELQQLRIFTEPQQGATYDDLLAVAQRAEAIGFGAFFRSDHYLKMGAATGLPGPTDAWVTLAALGRETRSIRLGTLVTAATFRHPGPLAISVAQADQMSGGRVELGIGAGWYQAEHDAYGIPFPPLGERFDILEEQLAIVTGMWATPSGDTFDFAGRHFKVNGSPGLPKPVQEGGVPVIIGGGGPKRTPRLAAQYATEFNGSFPRIDDYPALRARVEQACTAVGRRSGDMTYSAVLVVCIGRDEAEFVRRARAIGREPDELLTNGICGTPAQARATLERWQEAGAQRIYLQVLDLADLDHLDRIADVLGD